MFARMKLNFCLDEEKLDDVFEKLNQEEQQIKNEKPDALEVESAGSSIGFNDDIMKVTLQKEIYRKRLEQSEEFDVEPGYEPYQMDLYDDDMFKEGPKLDPLAELSMDGTEKASQQDQSELITQNEVIDIENRDTLEVSKDITDEVIGWGSAEPEIASHDEDDNKSHVTTSYEFRIIENRPLSPDLSGSGDGMYEGFGESKINDKKRAALIAMRNALMDEEYDSKRPWRKAPPSLTVGLTQLLESEPQTDPDPETSTVVLGNAAPANAESERNIVVDDHSSEGTLSEIGEASVPITSMDDNNIKNQDKLLVAQNCLILFQTMAQTEEYFERPEFDEIPEPMTPECQMHRRNIEGQVDEDGQQITFNDLNWLQQLSPNENLNASIDLSGSFGEPMVLPGSFSLGGFFGGGRKNNDDDSQGSDDSLSKFMSGNTASWVKIRKMFANKKLLKAAHGPLPQEDIDEVNKEIEEERLQKIERLKNKKRSHDLWYKVRKVFLSKALLRASDAPLPQEEIDTINKEIEEEKIEKENKRKYLKQKSYECWSKIRKIYERKLLPKAKEGPLPQEELEPIDKEIEEERKERDEQNRINQKGSSDEGNDQNNEKGMRDGKPLNKEGSDAITEEMSEVGSLDESELSRMINEEDNESLDSSPSQKSEKKYQEEAISKDIETGSIHESVEKPKYDIAKIDAELFSHRKKNISDRIIDFFLMNKVYMLYFLFVTLVVAGIFYAAMLSRPAPSNTSDNETDNFVPPDVIGRKIIYNMTGETTGSISISGDAESVVQVIDGQIIILNSKSGNNNLVTSDTLDALSTSSNIRFSPDGKFLVELILGNSTGQVIVRTLTPTLSWMIFVDQILNFTIESLSVSNGCRMVVGVPSYSMNGIDSGLVRVYDFCRTSYALKQVGGDILGLPESKTGNSVSLSEDGTMLAISSQLLSEVQVYQYNNTASNWHPIGNLLTGRHDDDYFGSSVSLSSNGKYLAVGASQYNSEIDRTKADAGMCQVYKLNGTRWDIHGSTIEGPEYQAQLGTVVTLSANGLVLFLGSATIAVESYLWDGMDWIKLEPDITIRRAKFLSASHDGWRLAVGEVNQTRVYEFELKIPEETQ